MAAPEGDVNAEAAARCGGMGRRELEGSRDVCSTRGVRLPLCLTAGRQHLPAPRSLPCPLPLSLPFIPPAITMVPVRCSWKID